MAVSKKVATSVVKRLQDAGFTAYFAGGYVRDYLMQKSSDDIDIATDASVDQIRSLFPKTIPVGVAFGILIVVEEGYHFEVATFRKDRGYVDGRRPTGIDPATAEEDASRRDFTINGLFFDPIKEQLFDFVEGEKDIQRKLIRAIGNPNERFEEDRLRMMRAVRYSTRFNFTIEDKTQEAIVKHAKDLFPSVAIERVWQEFKKMSHNTHFKEGLTMLFDLGLLTTIFPQLEGLSKQDLLQRVYWINHFPKLSPTFAQLMELFPEHSEEEIFQLAEDLKISNQEKAFVKFYLKAKHLFSMPNEWLEKLEPYEWTLHYADPSSEISLAMIACKKGDPEEFLSFHRNQRQKLEKYIERVENKKPFLRAEHLIEIGVKPGEKMGFLLEEGMRYAVNMQIVEPHILIKILQEKHPDVFVN